MRFPPLEPGISSSFIYVGCSPGWRWGFRTEYQGMLRWGRRLFRARASPQTQRRFPRANIVGRVAPGALAGRQKISRSGRLPSAKMPGRFSSDWQLNSMAPMFSLGKSPGCIVFRRKRSPDRVLGTRPIQDKRSARAAFRSRSERLPRENVLEFLLWPGVCEEGR